MSGLQVNVRQIGSYPQQAAAGHGDLVLVQQGGLGGPYYTTSPLGLLAPLETHSLAVGVGLPPKAGRGNLLAQSHVAPREGEFLWNAYRTVNGYRTWLSGLAARLNFQSGRGGLAFAVAPSQGAQEPIAAFLNLLTVNAAGGMRLPRGTLQVARDPSGAYEVATRRYVDLASVSAFNGRRGLVHLEAADVLQALGVASPLMTEGMVDQRIGALLYSQPFVFTWNGRLGNVALAIEDITEVFCRPGTRPISPTPPDGDFSKQIANTEWVSGLVYDKLLPDIRSTYAPLHSPRFSGTPTVPIAPLDAVDGEIVNAAWVRSYVNLESAGVASFNGRSGTVVLSLADIIGAQGQPQTTVTGAAPPITALGQFWFDPASKGLFIATASGWVPAGAAVEVSGTAPAVPGQGQLWFDSLTGDFSIWYEQAAGVGQWVSVSGPMGPEGPIGPQGIQGIQGIQGEPGQVIISALEPAAPADGELWFDGSAGGLFIWLPNAPPLSGGQWIEAGGSQGPVGPPGVQGVQGPQGIQGPAGPGLRPMGNVATFTALPTSGQQAGDLWVTSDTSTGYAWSDVANDWVNLGPLGAGMPDAPATGDNYGRQSAGVGGPLGWQMIQDDGAY